MPPSVLISDDRDVVTSALESKPKFTDPQSIALYNWCFQILTVLLNYVTYFIGYNSDRIDGLTQTVDQLTTQVEELHHHASQPAPDPLPARQPTTSIGRRCQRCNTIGHDTSTCRTKDPVAVKKRVANNSKIKKAAASIQGQLPIPPRLYPYNQYFGDPFIPSQQPLQSYYAAIADAKELRRRKVQSAWDRRRTNGVASNS
jgi:hypothetical protein